MATPGSPILVASSSLRPRGSGHGVHPQHLTMQPCVVGFCSSPGLRSPVFPTQKTLVLPRSPIPPGPSASPYPVVVSKHDVTAERPVDVQVYLRDVLGGDQGLLFHLLWENHGGDAGIRDTDPDMSQAAVLSREPWGNHASVSCRTSFLPLGGWGWQECPPCPWDLCEGLCTAVVGGEVTEGQPGWDGIGVQPRWEGTLGCCAQDCESEKPLRS